jgi:probable HAF family extracellular repeat protein
MKSWFSRKKAPGYKTTGSVRKPSNRRIEKRRPAVEPLEERCLLSYQILDLGPISSPDSQGNAINSSGQVPGFDINALGNADAVIFIGSTTTTLGTLGGTFGTAMGINDSGTVVGEATLSGDVITHAFQFSGGKMTDLGSLGGTVSLATSINASGQVAGESNLKGDLAAHAFLYSGGKMTDLGTLGGPNSQADAINASGQIVGGSYNSSTAWHAFLYSSGKMTDLGTLGGTESEAHAINTSGQVVGEATTAGDAANRAFLYSGGKMTNLGTLGGANSIAYGINDAGQVVGVSDVNTYTSHPFLYSGGKMTDLAKGLPARSLWQLESASGINNVGQVSGYGIAPSGFEHAFLMSPMPSVASATPTGTGIGPVSQITLNFSQPIMDGTFTLADIVTLTGPQGAITATAVNKISTTQYTVVFPPQSAAGTYTLTVGPNILGLDGLAMDQNNDGVPGTSSDKYTTTFTLKATPLHYVFGPSTTPPVSGYTLITSASTYKTFSPGFGWSAGTVYSVDRGTGANLIRYLDYTKNATFSVDMANGNYTVTVTMGDATTAHDNMGIFLQGTQVDTVNTAAGASVSKTYHITVSNGRLDLGLQDLGGTDPYAIINELDIVAG